MRKLTAAFSLMLVLWLQGDALSSPADSRGTSVRPGFPHVVRVRLWYLHPPRELKLRADNAGATIKKCSSCKETTLDATLAFAFGSSIQMGGDRSSAVMLRLEGSYQMNAPGQPPIRADFPIEIRADNGHLVITAFMPMEEYIAGVLAGETGNFKSDEALKAMSVAARTYAEHFGSRHALDGFDFCDTTHCQDLRLGGIDARMRKIAYSTAGEVLWYDGEPAATYYYANCGGTTEDGHYILGNDEVPAPYLKQHSDRYCVRNGGSQWGSDVSKRDLQHALAAEGINIPGTLRSVSVISRTASGRVEFLRVGGSSNVTVSGVLFRAAVGRQIGWDRLKSNWYDVSVRGDRVVFHGRGFGHGVGLCQVGAEIMGEEGRTYREILGFYYPGTHLGSSAQGIAWQQLVSDDIELLTTRPDRDRSLLPIATRFMHQSEESTGLIYRNRPRLKVYATVSEFRDATGEPGWVAASTRGRTIQLQPSDLLRDAGTLNTTIYHELMHMLIESYARPGTPRWFREGLVLYLTTPSQSSNADEQPVDVTSLEASLRAPENQQALRAAYAQARARVTELAQRHGKGALLSWIQNGLPPDLMAHSNAPGSR